MPENTRKNSDQNSMAWSWYPWIILRVQIESCNLATHPTNSAEPPSNLNHLPTFKKKHPKAKMSSLPYKKKTFKKKKLPPSYYTHLVLIGISASRLLVVFFATIMTPGGKARPVLHDIQKHPALLELSAFSTCSNGCCTFRGIGKGKIFWW